MFSARLFSNLRKMQNYWEWQIFTPYNKLESWADILHELKHTQTHTLSLSLSLTLTLTRTYTHTLTRTKTHPKTFKLWQILFPWKFSFVEILTSKRNKRQNKWLVFKRIVQWPFCCLWNLIFGSNIKSPWGYIRRIGNM